MALICSFERFSLSGLLLFSSCMNFSHLEMKSRSDSFALGFGTGIKNHTGNNLSGTFNALGSAPTRKPL